MNLYPGARAITEGVVRAIFGLHVIGAEHVPLTGGLLVAANHVSNLDPPVLGVACPRPVSYMAKKELFAMPVLGPLISRLHAFPVDRQAGGTAALRASLRMLRDGHCIGIFPEGGRNVRGDNEEKAGAAFLASASGAPVVPAAIVGTRRLRPFHRVTVIFGEPFVLERNRKSDSGDLAKGTAEIMLRIRALEESIR